MKTLSLIVALLLTASMALATGGKLAHTNPQQITGGEPIQGAAPDPTLTILISDAYSHNVTLTDRLWYDLVFNGTGTCYVRLMGNTTKASWTQEPVTTGTSHSYVVNPGRAVYLNYSGCTPAAAPANSIIHLQ